MNMAADSKIDNGNSMESSYDFYIKVLKSPKYILAPMVGQSELAWRMLARRHGAELCYSPMYNALTFLNDKNYRKEVLCDVSCKQDRPLIVQFCANNVKHFVSAAMLVEDHCDGVDLNLGCPQHIAKRGHYGAYLQDDWELLHNIIAESCKQLKIGVSAKIRVFSEISKTVQYAKMLEKAGCHFLTVHGRTRDQKRLQTGLASWNHIKAVKESLSIPVFANGNIQYGADVGRCMEETGVDGVMTAEGHLTNPIIFKGAHPNVFDVIDEYLSFVQLYPTPMSHVRTHVFNLLSNVFQRHRSMMSLLATASAIEDVAVVCERLRKLCEQDDCNPSSIISTSGLPYWVCQPYNKFKHDRLNFEEALKDPPPADETSISKNEQKRQKRERRRIDGKKKKRAKEHRRQKERVNEANRKLREEDDVLKSRVLRNIEQKRAVLERLDAAMRDDENNLVVCLDLSWSTSMSEKEISKLASQLGRLYGSNRNSANPAHLYFAGFERGSTLWKECVRKHSGFEDYKIDMTPKPCMELFDSNDVIYLTPDSPTALAGVEPGTVYVLGGLVDETVTKKLTLTRAQDSGIETRRLPVHEYMSRSEKHSNYSTVYCVNQVFDILLAYYRTEDWTRALSAGVPPRKGYVLNQDCLPNANTLPRRIDER